MIAFDDLKLKLNTDLVDIKWSEDVIISVRQYLPIEEKEELIRYVVNAALDDKTGCFSPLRLEVYFCLAVCKWYTDIAIEPLSDAGQLYDLLDSSGLMSQIMSNISKEELDFVKDLVTETTNDIARYNNSAAGIIQNLSNSTEGLDNQLSEVIEKIKNSEGLETLSAIKDVVGKD